MTIDPRGVPLPKVLFIVPHLTNSMRLLADYMRHLDRAFEPTILVTEHELRFAGEFPPEVPIEVLDEGMRYMNAPHTLWKMYDLARRNDLVVSWAELTPTYLAATAAILSNRPAVGWIHQNLSRIFNLKMRPAMHKPILRLFYSNIAATVGCSKEVAEDLRDKHHLSNSLAIVNGVDVDRIREMAQLPIPEPLRSVFDQPVIINVAGLQYQKHPDLLFRAHKILLDQGIVHRVLWIGDGPLRGEMEKLIAELGIGDSAILGGYVDNPWPLIKAAKVFALVSRFEGCPLVVAEAVAIGTPIVSADCPSGPKEILDHGRFGTLVPVDDLDKNVAALRKTLLDEPFRADLKSRLEEGAARQDIKPRVREMEQLFHRCLDNRVLGVA
jgi:glycosyltransferase involved in cell wall biosynthesis